MSRATINNQLSEKQSCTVGFLRALGGRDTSRTQVALAVISRYILLTDALPPQGRQLPLKGSRIVSGLQPPKRWPGTSIFFGKTSQLGVPRPNHDIAGYLFFLWLCVHMTGLYRCACAHATAQPWPNLTLALKPSTYPTPCDLGLILGPLDGWFFTVGGWG